MKKVVLAATTALVAAGSAAALEVTLGGQVTATVAYSGGTFADAVIGNGDDDGVSLTISGESMGWTYGSSVDLMAGTFGSVTLGNAGLGSLELKSTGISWSGMNVAGFDVSISTSLTDIEAATFGVSGSLGGISVAGDITNDANRSFDLDLGTAVAGASVAINMIGNLDDTSDIAYSVELGMSAMGSDLTISMNEAGAIGVEAAMGALTLSTSLTDGDSFNNLSLEYAADLADGLSVSATVAGEDTDQDGAADATSLSVSTVLSF